MAKKSTATKRKTSFWVRHRRLLRWSTGIIGALIILQAGLWIAFQVSPWPNALLIRRVFDENNAKISKALEPYLPNDVSQTLNQAYRLHDSDARLNVFYPAAATGRLPTIVWVHGGAWVSGSKDDMNNYLRIIAAHGFTAVSVNYSIAPEKQYPTPIVQLNDALGYLQMNASRLHVDATHFVLAGDSAGSQIIAQMAAIITSPSYADAMAIQPKLPATSLNAVLLNCGAYDLALPNYNGSFGKFLHTVLWAYSGTQDFLHDPKLATASVVNYLTPSFPPAFITAGNVDPLLNQSVELADKLKGQGVTTSTLFYPANHQPQLNHEYQFSLNTVDGQKALQQMLDFVHQRVNAH